MPKRSPPLNRPFNKSPADAIRPAQLLFGTSDDLEQLLKAVASAVGSRNELPVGQQKMFAVLVFVPKYIKIIKDQTKVS